MSLRAYEKGYITCLKSIQQTEVLHIHLSDLPQWSHVWHPEQMIHALAEWQETRVCQGCHPKERNAMVLNITTRRSHQACRYNLINIGKIPFQPLTNTRTACI